MHFDSVRIHVSDLDDATHTYERLLGVRAVQIDDGARRLQLGRGAVELEAGEPMLHSLRFTTDDSQVTSWPDDPDAFYGLRVHVGPPLRASSPDRAGNAVDAIDHVVIHSPDLDRARGLWRDRLGLRLALDRKFPGRGLRMLFFRSGGVTLEFVSPLGPPSSRGPDRLYGMAYRVTHLDAYRTRLLANGLDVSATRPGHKPGTAVATVRSGTAGIPSLLLSVLDSE